MNGVNFLAIIASVFAAFLISSFWYSPLLFGRQWLALRGVDANALADKKMPPGEIIGEIVRTLIIAIVLAHFVVLAGAASIFSALTLASWIWIGFYATILAGSVLHDKVPLKLAAIHAGDGLVRIISMTVIISICR